MALDKLPVKKLVEFRRLSKNRKVTFTNKLKVGKKPAAIGLEVLVLLVMLSKKMIIHVLLIKLKKSQIFMTLIRGHKLKLCINETLIYLISIEISISHYGDRLLV